MAQQTTCPVACLFTSAHYSANATIMSPMGRTTAIKNARILNIASVLMMDLIAKMRAAPYCFWADCRSLSLATGVRLKRRLCASGAAKARAAPATVSCRPRGSAVRLADCPQANSPATRSDIVRGMSKAPLTDSHLYALRAVALGKVFRTYNSTEFKTGPCSSRVLWSLSRMIADPPGGPLQGCHCMVLTAKGEAALRPATDLQLHRR